MVGNIVPENIPDDTDNGRDDGIRNTYKTIENPFKNPGDSFPNGRSDIFNFFPGCFPLALEQRREHIPNSENGLRRCIEYHLDGIPYTFEVVGNVITEDVSDDIYDCGHDGVGNADKRIDCGLEKVRDGVPDRRGDVLDLFPSRLPIALEQRRKRPDNPHNRFGGGVNNYSYNFEGVVYRVDRKSTRLNSSH